MLSARSYLYLEVYDKSLRFLFANKSKNEIAISNFGYVEIPDNCVQNGLVVDSINFTKCVKEIMQLCKIKHGKVFLCLVDGSIVTRLVQIPIINEKDIKLHLQLEAGQYLPINPDNFIIDFRIIETMKSGNMSKVLLTAGPNDNIRSLLSAIDESKLHPKVIDIYPNNICRLFSNLDEKDIAIIDLGRNYINITILENHNFYMYTYMTSSINQIIDELLQSDDAIQDKRYEDFIYESFDYLKLNSDHKEMDAGLYKKIDPTFNQINRYLDYYNSRHFGKSVEKIYIIGDMALLKGLYGYVKAKFGTRVEIGLKTLPVKLSEKNISFFGSVLNYLNLIGFALRGVG